MDEDELTIEVPADLFRDLVYITLLSAYKPAGVRAWLDKHKDEDALEVARKAVAIATV